MSAVEIARLGTGTVDQQPSPEHQCLKSTWKSDYNCEDRARSPWTLDNTSTGKSPLIILVNLSLQHANPSLCDSIAQGHMHWLKNQDCAFILVTLQPPQ